jgi:hypothetical protein
MIAYASVIPYATQSAAMAHTTMRGLTHGNRYSSPDDALGGAYGLYSAFR